MQKHFIRILVLSVLVTAAHCGPVLIWHAEVQPKSVFPRISQHEFINEIKPLLETKMVAAFLYKKLTLKSFRCEGCFPYLSQQTQAYFYANVERPEKALLTLNVTAHLKATNEGNLDAPLSCRVGTLYTISLDVLSRAQNPMRSCDDVIKAITEASGCGDVAYLFLGTQGESDEPIGHLHQHNQLSFYFTEFQTQTADEVETIYLQSMNVSGVDPILTVEFQANNTNASLTFSVLLSNGYFEIKSFKYNETQYYVTDLYAPQTSSYSCGKISLHNDKEAIILKRVQLQYDKDTRVGDFRFKDAWTCEAFTSPAIISGIFITAILLTALSVGIGMLMSVQSPTKFESTTGRNLYIHVRD
ncbi:V-type proton ATPase subunit S1-like [Bactrocera neohumeralis]|uniref:V-type proton ATPase subunit S1-like n=1 Tax=Bactrocera tryoni TaxID=59916 RepID=UPI001A9713DC|nr:V-type proton ATPase subunit S1-like [Bactrocera tryoni]XP_050319871.1 V-type proton ATPase subunit S1-like [Bactrocera neohumeralis]